MIRKVIVVLVILFVLCGVVSARRTKKKKLTAKQMQYRCFVLGAICPQYVAPCVDKNKIDFTYNRRPTNINCEK